MNVLMFHYY